MLKLAIDCGHGLGTKGKQTIQNPPIKEWSLNNLVAHKLTLYLSDYDGIDLVRVDDIYGRHDILLSQRVAKANSLDVDLYLSIHHNAGRGEGVEVYKSLTNKSEFGTLLVNNIADESKLKNRGVKTRKGSTGKDYYYVIRETKMKCYLIECGFMDNWSDLKIITTEKGADRIARGIGESLVQKYGLKKKQAQDEYEKIVFYVKK